MPGVLAKKLAGFFCKLREAVLAAEVIGLPVMLLFSRSPRRIHIHAADRIDDGFILPAGLLDGGSMCGRGGFHEPLRVLLELRYAVLAQRIIILLTNFLSRRFITDIILFMERK
jgi:hypothetical protein